MDKKSIGEFLSALRKAKDYTQQEVADKLNISNRTLSSWETDRTVPDILLLPAIADLYGVTADEILRGERRNERQAETEISDGAKRAVRKNRYGKFTTKLLLFGLLAFMGSVLFSVGGTITAHTYYYNYDTVWVYILIMAIGAACMAVFSALVFYFMHATACAEGIILKEDLSGKNRAFMLNIKNKTALFLAVLALPLLICGIVTGLIAIFYPPKYIRLIQRIFFACVFLAIALILIVCATVLYCRNISKLGNDTQIYTYRNNAKLLAKTCGFSAILPVILAIVWVVLHFTCAHTVNALYTEKDFDKFKTERETLIIDEDMICTDGSAHSLYAGEYRLQFPTAENGQLPDGYYDLVNGFWGEIYTYSNFEQYCTVYYNPSITNVTQIGEYGLAGEQEPCGVYIGNYRYEYLNGKPFVSVNGDNRYGITDYEHYFWGGQDISRYWGYEGGYYGFFEYIESDFNAFAGGIFLLGTIASVAIYSIIFAVIRKKQNYSF